MGSINAERRVSIGERYETCYISPRHISHDSEKYPVVANGCLTGHAEEENIPLETLDPHCDQWRTSRVRVDIPDGSIR